MKNIPVIRSSMPPFEDYTQEISDLWESRWLSNHGSKAAELEKQTAELLGAEHIISAVNGHQALEIALRGLDLKGEVITSPFTFVSTTAAIVRCGLKPVFCDIRKSDYTLDPSCLEGLINKNTCAILGVHVYGNLCDDAEIMRIAHKYNLKVIYDAAHAFGTECNGRKVAELGDVSVFSLHATKAFHSIEGGLVAYNNPELQTRFWEEQNFGISAQDSVARPAPNAKMNEFQAAMGLCNLKYFKDYVTARKTAYDRYHQRLEGVAGLTLYTVPEGTLANYAYFPVFIDPVIAGTDRNQLSVYLGEQGIGSRKYFWPLTSSFSCYRSYATQATPVADRLSEQVLTLPMYSDLTIEDVDYICDNILACLKKNSTGSESV